MTTLPQTQTSHQFFYFYHASILVVEALGVLMSILQQVKPNVAQTYRWLAVPEFVLGVFSLVLFICTIAALIVWKKKRYAGYTYWTPAVYLALSIVMAVLGAVWSIQKFSTDFKALGENPSQAEMEAVFNNVTLPMWLYLASYTSALITGAVTVWVWLKFKAQQTLTAVAPTRSPKE